MSKTIQIGKNTLGSGGKMEINLHNYDTSTSDKGYTFKTTGAAGTLIPFMSEVALPESEWEIDLDADVMTHPTIGPLFDSFKVQLDVFVTPMRLYNGKLHMNMLNIGKKMADIKIPQVELKAISGNDEQVEASSIFSYLDIRGLGRYTTGNQDPDQIVKRKFNAIPYLNYFDIYKNYYANKQEEIGVIIHNNMNLSNNGIIDFTMFNKIGGNNYLIETIDNPQTFNLHTSAYAIIQFGSLDPDDEPDLDLLYIDINGRLKPIKEVFKSFRWESQWVLKASMPRLDYVYTQTGVPVTIKKYAFGGQTVEPNKDEPKLKEFPLKDIDDKRIQILTHTNSSSPFIINDTDDSVYGLPLKQGTSGMFPIESKQEGLLIKTYQSDLFNNWVSTEWIDGDNGVNAITAIDTSSGSFNIDTLNMSKKVYNMLNRIMLSGGSYDDWIETVYMGKKVRAVENPVYVGGLIKELAFQEVISNSQTSEQPLGTLAGRGRMTSKHKGGFVKIEVEEPSYIMGIISLTPRVCYSQGNKWDVNLKTMDDLHKPALDGIGFQDLITDQMMWGDTRLDNNGNPTFKSAGKQPAWINYQTNVDKTRGNFAKFAEQMWMTLNRNYEEDDNGIADLTTYIDPSKFNNIFADTRLDAMNFWIQVKVNAKVVQKMSARQIPNL